MDVKIQSSSGAFVLNAPSSPAPAGQAARSDSAAAQEKLQSLQSGALAMDSSTSHVESESETRRKASRQDLPQKRQQSIEQLRQMPLLRLRRIFFAAQGHQGNESAIDQELDRGAQAMLESFNNETFEGEMDKYARDPLRQYLLLATAVKLLESRLQDNVMRTNRALGAAAQAQLARLNAALDRLLRRQGKRIRGGLNTAEALQHFSDAITERDELRDIYYDAIVTGPSVRDTIERLLQAFGPDRFAHAVRVMRRAINDDMRAPFPSANRILLETYYHGLRDAQLITSLIRATADLEKRIGPTGLRNKANVGEFLIHILRFTEGPGNTRQFNQICEAVAGKKQAEEQAALEAEHARAHRNDDLYRIGSVDVDEPEQPVREDPEKVAFANNKNLREDALNRHVRNFMLREVPVHLWARKEIRDNILVPGRSLPAAPGPSP